MESLRGKRNNLINFQLLLNCCIYQNSFLVVYENINHHHHNYHYYHIHRHNFNRKTSTVGHNLLEPPTYFKQVILPSLVAILRCILFLERRWRWRSIAVSIQGVFVLNGHSLSMLNGPPLDISTTWMMNCDKGTPVKSVIIYYRFMEFAASGTHSECRWSRMAGFSNPPVVIGQTCMNFN